MHVTELIWNDPWTRQYYISAVLLFIPVARIMKRAGFSPLWAGLLIVPGIGLLLCFVLLALRKWSPAKEVLR